MTYPEAIQFLYDLQLFGARLGLDAPRALAAWAGNPQDKLRFIHVAGTNGKGSTCAMLESIYGESWLRVGLYTSPHLVSFRERIQTNRQPINEADVVRLTEELRGAPATAETHPTFFEFVTIMALKYFAEQRCDLVILETGLGGRLDATNIVTPLASVITNIALDHQEWLGGTLEKIAAEKAGIIKRDVPAVTATDAPEALRVIEEAATRMKAPLTVVDAATVARLDIPVSLRGAHQRTNAALALATVKVLREKLPVDDAAIRRGLATVQWPGRMQLLQLVPSRQLLLDGAHNVAGIEALCAALRSEFAGREFALVLGILRDKDWAPMVQRIAPLARRILLPPVTGERALPTADLAAACRRANPRAELSECASIADALTATAGDPFTVVTGSLYFIGSVLEALGHDGVSGVSELALNDYTRAGQVSAAAARTELRRTLAQTFTPTKARRAS